MKHPELFTLLACLLAVMAQLKELICEADSRLDMKAIVIRRKPCGCFEALSGLLWNVVFGVSFQRDAIEMITWL